ncbi:DUF5947 family protein [Streptomyces sp. LP05-1]|uniref:DUF5947 family protein n=1 Tax=Streptomyces pyxinae TaxID=2970734 RepID=A0ABT2CPZ1_9ACTN|nr:DUF5947 family protein [Streptomyces sp. LP05-1]MCS0639507.1 DUF5947 family protein [Streptomyces sp. LP05-1]
MTVQGGRPGPGGGPATTVPAGLRRFTERPAPKDERCELCAAPLTPAGHRHLVDTGRRSLKCACTGCHLLFTRPGAGGGRFLAVPDRYLHDPDFAFTEGDWTALQIPVGLAFLFRNAALDRYAVFYPSPVGATESELDPGLWDALLGRTRLAALLEPDVEALLLHCERGEPTSCHLVPVDVCYELVGRMRLHWQGFDGGAEARSDLADFFGQVQDRARALEPLATRRADGADGEGGA